MGPGRRGRAAPERKGVPRDAPIERLGNVETVVAVALVVRNQASDLVPTRPPGWSRQPKPRSKTCGIAKREIEAYQHSFVTRTRRHKPFGDKRLGCVASWRIDQGFTMAAAPADPNAVAADPRHVRRAPIDDHKAIEHQT